MSKCQTYVECPICGKEFKSLGYARHRAMHRDNAKKGKLDGEIVKRAKKCGRHYVSILHCPYPYALCTRCKHFK